MKKIALRPILGIVILVALAVAGCGGSEESESPPSKEAFVRKGNLVCVEGTKKKEELRGEGVALRLKTHGQVPPKRIEQFTSELMEIYEGEAERIAELTPPAGDKKRIEALVSAMNEAAERYRANPEAGGVPFGKADRLALAYGLDKCLG